jgi:hypothetical protein
MLSRNFSNGKERSSGTSLFLRLAKSASIEEVLEDLTEIAAEKGIHLYSVRVKRGRLEREFKPPNTVAVAGRISELAAECVNNFETPAVKNMACDCRKKSTPLLSRQSRQIDQTVEKEVIRLPP